MNLHLNLTGASLHESCFFFISEAYTIMRDELVPTESALEASPKYRKDLAAGFLYKVPCCQ